MRETAKSVAGQIGSPRRPIPATGPRPTLVRRTTPARATALASRLAPLHAALAHPLARGLQLGPAELAVAIRVGPREHPVEALLAVDRRTTGRRLRTGRRGRLTERHGEKHRDGHDVWLPADMDGDAPSG